MADKFTALLVSNRKWSHSQHRTVNDIDVYLDCVGEEIGSDKHKQILMSIPDRCSVKEFIDRLEQLLQTIKTEVKSD